jgi:hypothetical protein
MRITLDIALQGPSLTKYLSKSIPSIHLQANASVNGVEMHNIAPPEGPHFSAFMGNFAFIIFVPDKPNLEDTIFVIELVQLLHKECIIL